MRKIKLYFILLFLFLPFVTAEININSFTDVSAKDIRISLTNTSFDNNNYNTTSTLLEKVINVFSSDTIINTPITKESKYNDYVRIRQEKNGTRIKETINITNDIVFTSDVVFNYNIETNGTLIRYNNEIYNIYNNKIIGIFRQPFITDSKNNLLYLNYTLKGSHLSFSVPLEYFNYNNYPFIIDPVYDDFSDYVSVSSSTSTLGSNIIYGSLDSNWDYYSRCFLYGQYSGYGSCFGDIINGYESDTLKLHSGNFQSLNVCGNSRNIVNSTAFNFSSYNYTTIKMKAINITAEPRQNDPDYYGKALVNISLFGSTIYSYNNTWNGTEYFSDTLGEFFNITIRKINNSFWLVTSDKEVLGTFENITYKNPDIDNLQFMTYTSASCNYDDGYNMDLILLVDDVSYSNTDTNIVTDYTNGCYQSRPDVRIPADNYFSPTGYCGLNYNGVITFNQGALDYTYMLPTHDNLTDIEINFRFGNSSKINHVFLAKDFPNCFESAVADGYLSLTATAFINSYYRTVYNIPFWNDYNNAQHGLYCYDYYGNSETIEYGRKNFTYPYSFNVGYNNVYNPFESYDNNFISTFNTYYAFYDFGYGSFDGWINTYLADTETGNATDNVSLQIYDVAKHGFLYDLSVTWYFANNSISSDITYYNGTCIWNNTFCSNPFYLGGFYYCDIDDIINDCSACVVGAVGTNISSDMCNQTLGLSCNNSCSIPNEISCYDSSTVQICNLNSNGCYQQNYFSSCPTGTYCSNDTTIGDNCLNNITTTTIPIATINITEPEDTSNVWFGKKVSSGLQTGTKFIILFIVLFIAFVLCVIGGYFSKMPELGIGIGIIFDIIIVISSSFPDFPIWGGIIPFWFVMLIVLIILIIGIFMVITRINAGGGE